MRHSVKSRFVVGLAVWAASICAVGVWARKANHSISQLQVGNKTRLLLIDSIAELDSVKVGQKTARQFKATVKNGYSQPVVAYALQQQDNAVGQGSTAAIETNGAAIGWVLAPNATDETNFSTTAEGGVVLTVAAVLLKDGTGDGDTETLSRLKDVRAGVKIAYQQIIQSLRRASDATAEPGSDVNIQSLEDEISATADERNVHGNLRRGFHEAKDLILKDLREIKNGISSGRHLEPRSEIAKVKLRVENVLANL